MTRIEILILRVILRSASLVVSGRIWMHDRRVVGCPYVQLSGSRCSWMRLLFKEFKSPLGHRSEGPAVTNRRGLLVVQGNDVGGWPVPSTHRIPAAPTVAPAWKYERGASLSTTRLPSGNSPTIASLNRAT